MSKSKRAQIPMEPDEYERLQALAEREGLSLAEMVREAVVEKYRVAEEKGRKQKALGKLLALPPIRVGDWKGVKKELADRRGALFP
jgi:hypothetical protein